MVILAARASAMKAKIFKTWILMMNDEKNEKDDMQCSLSVLGFSIFFFRFFFFFFF